MKKAFSLVLAALLLAGTTTVFAADNAPTADAAQINLNEHIVAYLKGDKEFSSGSLEEAFDCTPATWADYGVEGGEEYWIGVQFAAPTVLSGVEFFSWDTNGDGVIERIHAIFGHIVEGSNDGENWEFILQFGDNYEEYNEYSWDMGDGLIFGAYEYAYDGESYYDDDATEPKAYTYYRVWNDCKGLALFGDIVFWGEIVQYTPGDINMDGALDVTDAMYLFQHGMLPDLFAISYPGKVDFTADGVLDINDAIYLFQHTMMPDLYPLA